MGSIDDVGSAEGDDIYGYGEDAISHVDDEVDFGYKDVEVDTVSNSSGSSGEVKRPKRRCSITKYSLEDATPLNAASVICDFRNGIEPNHPTPSSSGPVETSLAADDSNDKTMADWTTSASIANAVAVKEFEHVISQDTDTPNIPPSTRTRKRKNIFKRFFRGMRRAQAA